MTEKSKNNNETHGLFFIGNHHETVPIRLLTDKYLTPRAKLAWQLIRSNAKQFQASIFPSYDELALWLSDKGFSDKKVSRKIVSQTILLLRLTRWLTLYKKLRNKRGQILGNVYVMNDEPISMMDNIEIDNDYLRFLEKALKHNDSIIRDVATDIVEKMLKQNKLNWYIFSHMDIIRERYSEYDPRLSKLQSKLPTNLEQVMEKAKDDLLTNMELSKKSEKHPSSNMELSKKSEKHPSSNMELSQKNNDNYLIQNHFNKSKEESYTCTVHSTNNIMYSTCTSELKQFLNELSLSPLEIKSVLQNTVNLDEQTIQAIMVETKYRLSQGNIKKPVGYLISLIKRAQRGKFNAYWINKGSKTEYSQKEKKPLCHQLLRNDPAQSIDEIEAEELRNKALARFAEMRQILRAMSCPQ